MSAWKGNIRMFIDKFGTRVDLVVNNQPEILNGRKGVNRDTKTKPDILGQKTG